MIVRQRLAVEELHDEEGGAVLLAEVVDGRDVGVAEAGAEPGLGAEPLGEVGVVAAVGTQHLDRDVPVERLVVGPPDLAHATRREHLGEAVAVGEQGARFADHGRAPPP